MSDVNGRGPSLRGAVDLSGLVNRPPAPAEGAGEASGAPVAPPAPVEGRIYAGSDQDFTQFLDLSAQVPVLALLWASWATPTAELSPVLERALEAFPGRFVLVTVDVDRNPQLAQAFQAQSVPMVAAVIGGRPVPLFQGAMPEDQLRELLERVLELAAQSGVTGTVGGEPPEPGAEGAAEPEPAPLPPLHQEAYDAIDRGDYAAAIEAYRKAIAQNPADDDAKAGLAQVSLLHRLQGKTLDAIRNAAALNPDSLAANLDVADLDLSGGHIEDAFDRLLALFPKLDADGRNAVRERLVELFAVVGVEDPRVARARGRLASLLY